MKERVTLTLDYDILRRVDKTINHTHVRNRSHAIELLLRRALSDDFISTAVILAGGSPQNINNCLKIVNDKPMIKHNVDYLIDSGVSNIIILSTDTNSLRPAVGDTDKADIQYIDETHPLGTAGSLNLISPFNSSSFVITNGDDYADVDLKDMYDFHKQSGGLCTIALTTISDPSMYGVALLNGNYVVTFVEKPRPENAPSNLISAGTYIMEPEVLSFVPEGYARIESDIFPKLVKDNKLIGFPYSGVHYPSSE